MPVAIVDILETVEIDVTNGQQLAAALRKRNGLPQAVGKQAPIGNAGERVVVGDMAQLGLMLLEISDIREYADMALDPARLVADGRDREQFRIYFAVLAPVPYFAAPGFVVFQRLPHSFVKRLVLTARTQELRIPAQHLIAGVTRYVGERRIDIDDDIVRIGDDDGFLAVVEYACGDAQSRLCLFQFGDVAPDDDQPLAPAVRDKTTVS